LTASGVSFEQILERAHDKISQLYNTQIPDGMHIFGALPEGERRQEMVRSILRSEARKAAAGLLGREVSTKIEDLRELDLLAKDLILAIMQDVALSTFMEARGLKGNGSLIALHDRVKELCCRLDGSKEMES